MQHKRILTLVAILLFVGVVTRVFAQSPVQTGDAAITRAGAVALMVEADPMLKARLRHHIDHVAPLPLFDDLDYEEWYAPYVETAFEAGIITGNKERLFRPGDSLLEEEMIVLGARFGAMSRPEISEGIARNGSSWFEDALLASVQAGFAMPAPVRVGQPARRSDFHAMLQSMDVRDPARITLTHRPLRPVTIPSAPARAPSTPTPVDQPQVQAPSQNPNPAPAQPAGPQPSQKPFAISLPSLDIEDLTITHPADPFTKDGLLAPLKYGVGHLFGYPGKGGKILIYGHSSSYPWDVSDYTKIFRQINKLNPGDLIHVTYNGTVHTYKVSYKQTVPADDVSAYGGGGGEELILYTCWPPDSIKERYLVHAVPVGR